MRASGLRAQELLLSEKIHLSVQVLQEFYVNAIHPRKLAYTKAEAVVICEVWMEFTVAALTVETFVRARLAAPSTIKNDNVDGYDGRAKAERSEASFSRFQQSMLAFRGEGPVDANDTTSF